jgi:hypothetical protein
LLHGTFSSVNCGVTFLGEIKSKTHVFLDQTNLKATLIVICGS